MTRTPDTKTTMEKKDFRPELNDRIRKKFFALYIDSCDCSEHGEDFVTEFNESTYIDILCSEQEECYLILRNVSHLTDDEAIQVAKIWRPDRDISFHSVKYGRSVIEGLDHLMVGFNVFGQITDYLRSIGIALPFMGYSVEELVAAGFCRVEEGGSHEA